MSRLDNLYKHSPTWMQNAMVSTFGVYWHWARFGGDWQKQKRGYQERELFSAEKWAEYQNENLKELLEICFTQVPYFRDTWSNYPQLEVKNGYLKGIPLLGKDPIRANPNLFRRQDMNPLPKLVFHTSGTTGTPIVSTFTLSELRNSMALREVRSANWAGVSFKDSRATFSGRMVEPNPQQFDSIYRYNAVEKQVYFSAFHLKPQTASQYVNALRKHKIIWMTGYAVSFYLLAKYILDQNLKVPYLKAVITTSEKLTEDMRLVMQKAFQCRVYEEYSTVESALFASECEHGRLHVSPDVGIVEILRSDGSPCDPGEIGEVVTTCLMRNYQPLVRFRLGDLAAWDPELCPCGRQMPVIKEVAGRVEDVVTGPDGRQLVRFHGIFVNQPHVVEGQIVQESLTNFTVKVIPTNAFSEEDILDIQNRMHQRLGQDVEVQVELVSEIPRTSAGKFQAVISKVKSF
jgi:phenylacetate-CoA ligase